ncbi:hypothetical protein JL100_028980 [Skermanella mucosa]|uniref:hypothetical protein n=1 Tax=Skermanella mucosa TaxID=1789672 RepID=UPI00192B13EC|nr:hypothetical protein [Skermanella mucosa]UEM21048.1 hypothetical protein JL100_028980 [Skermanella mucosa]
MTVMIPAIRIAAALATLVIASLPGWTAQAASKPELRSFTAPPGRDDGRPRPDRAPQVGVEQRLLPPPGAWDTPPGIGDSAFALACSAGEAAALTPAAAMRPAARCPDPFTVIVEQP